MARHSFIFGIFILSVFIQSESSILDWFRSKPKWAKSIDKIPLVEAFHPKGLRVSISDVNGMEVFGFHGNLNQCFKRGESGALYGNVTKPTNGRWVFIDENIELKLNDALHYWIYVKVNGEEYSFSKDVYMIRNLVQHPGDLRLHNTVDERFDRTPEASPHTGNHLEEKVCTCPSDVIPIYAPIPNSGSAVHNSIANGQPDIYIPAPSVSNVPSLPIESDTYGIQSELISCGFHVDSLNEVILDLLKDTNMHSKLVLVGKTKENNDSSAMEQVKRFLVHFLELYDLGKKIKTAKYLDCGIYFEMSSIVDKKRILLRAATDMRNVDCKFLEPLSLIHI